MHHFIWGLIYGFAAVGVVVAAKFLWELIAALVVFWIFSRGG